MGRKFFIPESEKIYNADEKQRVRPPIYPAFAFHNPHILEVRHYQCVRGLLKVSIDNSKVSKPSRNLFSISSSVEKMEIVCRMFSAKFKLIL